MLEGQRATGRSSGHDAAPAAPRRPSRPRRCAKAARRIERFSGSTGRLHPYSITRLNDMTMSSNFNPKRALYAQFAVVAKAIAHEHRLELLELVAQGERSVEALAERSGLSIANVSQHLQHLRRAGLVASRRQAKFVLYRLADEAVLTMLAALQQSGGAQRRRGGAHLAQLLPCARRTGAGVPCRAHAAHQEGLGHGHRRAPRGRIRPRACARAPATFR